MTIMGTLHQSPDFDSSRPLYTTEDFLEIARNINSPSQDEKKTILEQQQYREGTLSIYDDWKAQFPGLKLDHAPSIISAWESLERHLDQQGFSCSPKETESKQTFYLHYDVQWCFLLDILASLYPDRRQIMREALTLYIPTHQKKPGVSTLEQIKNLLTARYADHLEQLPQDIEKWSITTSSVVRLYQSDVFSEAVQNMTRHNDNIYRDGLANSLNIATRQLRDLGITCSGQIVDAKSRREMEQTLIQKIKNAVSDLLIP